MNLPAKIAAAAAAAALLAALAGCATTTTFQKAAAHVGTDLAADATRYATADATVDAATRGLRLSQAAAFTAATADSSSISDQSVYAAWAPVEPWYRGYIAADPTPTITPARRANLLGRCDTFDQLIAHEAARPLGAGTRPVTP